MPKFSIIVPVYNAAPYLRECLDSVLNQTFIDWECVVVNDGSTDESGAILDEYAAKDVRVRIFHKKNGGVASARNSALERTEGEYILFLDNDDALHPQTLERLQDILLREPGARLIKFEVAEGPDLPVWAPLPAAEAGFIDLSREIDFAEFYSLCCQYCYARELLEGLTFPDLTRGEDRVFISEILLNRVVGLRRLPVALYAYRQRPSSVTHARQSARNLLDDIRHRRDILFRIHSSPKRVTGGKSFWIEGFFLFQFPQTLRSIPPDDRPALRAAWLRTLRELLTLPDLTSRERFFYRLLLRLPEPLRYLLLRLLRFYSLLRY